MNDTDHIPTHEVQSFYESALTEADRPLFDIARKIEGLADEVALLRLRLRAALIEHPDDARLIEGGVRLLIQSMLAQHRLSRQQADDLSSAVSAVFEQAGEALRGAIDV